jgi:hypothetical protein
VEQEGAFLEIPAVVAAALNDVDLLDVVLTGVSHPQSTRGAVIDRDVKQVPGSLEEVLGALEADHDFLLDGACSHQT